MKDQVALVTGAGSAEGIGFAVARRMHAAGAKVVITSTTDRIHSRARELDPDGRDVLALVADLSDEAAAQHLVDSVLARLGRIDVLVNNAGMAQSGVDMPSPELQQFSYADWRRQIQVTLDTAFLMTRAVLPGMVERTYGRVVNVSSVTGPLVSARGMAAYGAAKAAMDGMMRAAAIETAAHGVTLNAVAPGWIATGSMLEAERSSSWPRRMPRTSPASRSSWMAATSSRSRRGPKLDGWPRYRGRGARRSGS